MDSETDPNVNSATSDLASSWITFVIICASIIVILVVGYIVYDLCVRFKKLKDLAILDGGPQPSPGHQSYYHITIVVDNCSPSFDTRLSAIKFDLLDYRNHYLTTFIVPSFVFKYKISSKLLRATNNLNAMNPLSNSTFIAIPESLEIWSNNSAARKISFFLVRRNPLIRCSRVRVSHDCFVPDASISFKSLTIVDQQTKERIRSDLCNKHIYARHPCPPSGFQVFDFNS